MPIETAKLRGVLRLMGDRIKSGGNSFEAVGKEKAYP
jgi:hypothetical protein